MYHVSFPGLGIHDLPIHREAFSLFGRLPIYWYGLIIAGAVLLTLFLASRQAPRFGIQPEMVVDTYLWMLPLAFLSARLYYVIFSWAQYKDNLLAIFDIRQGGLAFYGGVLGGLLAFIGMARHHHRRLANWVDFFVVYLPLGQALGRWGNFFNQEAFGSNTTLPWGMYSEGTVAYLNHLLSQGQSGLDPAAPVHPTFLYECLGNLLIFVLLLWIRQRSRIDYETTAWYLMLYGGLRFFVEGVRTDPLYIMGTNLRVSQVLSLLMVMGSILYLAYAYRHPEAHAKDWMQGTEPAEEACHGEA